MRKLLIISFLLLVGSYGFGQKNFEITIIVKDSIGNLIPMPSYYIETKNTFEYNKPYTHSGIIVNDEKTKKAKKQIKLSAAKFLNQPVLLRILFDPFQYKTHEQNITLTDELLIEVKLDRKWDWEPIKKYDKAYLKDSIK